MLIPALMVGLITAHLAILWLQKHTQFPGGRATEMNVVGRHLWPNQAFRSLGLLFLTAAVLAGVAGLVQINPVWVYGPFIPYAVSSPAQPDWYLGWLEGSLRLGPNWEPTILGVTIPSPFVPGILLPAIVFGGFTLVALPRGEVHPRPRRAPPPPVPVAGAGSGRHRCRRADAAPRPHDRGRERRARGVPPGGLEQLTWASSGSSPIVAPIVVGLIVYRLAIERRRRATAEDDVVRTRAARLSLLGWP